MTGRRLATIFLAATVVAAAGTFFYFGSATPVAHARNSTTPSPRSAKPVSLPMFFEANQGQTDARVKFLSRGRGYGLFLTSDEAVLRLQRSAVSHQPSASSVIRMRLQGGNTSARVSGAELLPGKSNYFIGNDPAKWHRGISQYARVTYESVYPGIDLTYYGHQGQLEYDFRLAPNADPSQIALTFDGATTRLDHGDLVLSTSNGDVRFQAPTIYQIDGRSKKAVTGSFRQLSDNKVGFQIGSYDRTRELVIDPALSYFTYLGGSGTETNSQVAVDPSLNIYLAGTTNSADFPETNGSAKTGTRNVFVAKLNPAIPIPQSQLIYATYIGGNGADDTAALAVDSSGQAYVAGSTTSTNYPFTANAFQPVPVGPGTHGFMTKLDSDGSTTLLYSTYLSGTNPGGSTVDLVTGLAIDTRGDAFLTGTTTSTTPSTGSIGFPSTPNAYQVNSLAETQFFASKIDTTKAKEQSMVYSTFFGGANPASPQVTGGGIAIDNSGNMYFTGATDFIFDPALATENPRKTNFPIQDAQQGCLDGAPSITACDLNAAAPDAFVAKINPNRTGTVGLVYSTYLGGSVDDVGTGIAVDAAGNAYVTGATLSNDWTPPTTIAPFQTQFVGTGTNVHDAFIAKIGNPNGSSSIFPLTYFTYLGGSGDDVGQSIAVDGVQGVHVTGSTSSPNLLVLNPLVEQLTYGGGTDAFVAQILTASSGRAAGDYLTYLGGSAEDHGTNIVVDVNGSAYVTGTTQSANFPPPNSPVSPSFQDTLNGPQDTFLSVISAISTFAEPDDTPPTVSPNPASLGNQVTFTFTFVNNGFDPAAGVVFKGTFPAAGVTFNSATSSPGGTCPAPVNATVLCNVGPVAVNAKVTVSIVLTPTTGTKSLNVTPFLSANGGPFKLFQTVPDVPVTDFSIDVNPKSVTITAGESTSFVATLAPNPTYASAISMSDSGLPTASTGTFTSTSVVLSGTSSSTTTLNITTTARPATTTTLFGGRAIYATWLPIGGLSLLGLGVGAGVKRRRWLAGMLLGLVAGLILLQPACGGSSSSATTTGGTPAGTYTLTITGSSGSASHNQRVTLIVN